MLAEKKHPYVCADEKFRLHADSFTENVSVSTFMMSQNPRKVSLSVPALSLYCP
jgi:hypothetical protein